MIHTDIVIGDKEDSFVAQISKISSGLPAAVKIIDHDVSKAFLRVRESVVDNEGHSYPVAQVLIIVLAKADEHHTVKIPHRGEDDGV